MATIKAIEGRSVHQIQSGQVIVDLTSVVKELVENSLDAGATSVEVRFKNQGLDSIEVLDNGRGIAPEDFDTIALKHYTSKLSSYEDLTGLETFGFRGEALSSLCALSNFHIVTARSEDGAVGKKLEFEISGKLKGTSIVAAQRGTTVSVEHLFGNLPVRRKELEKNIKREYAKVTGHLHAYAGISVGVRFAVSNQMPKGKKLAVFSTKSNATTKENIANVFGAKTLLALVKLDLRLDMEPSKGPSTQSARSWSTPAANHSMQVQIQGHISKPIFGEGRQAPDRQMFFVNSRPCGLPQISKAFNEVYRSFNVSQSPFIFANLIMDTGAYDVNVSPDKRSIMLHDQTALLEALKMALTELFEATDQTMPQFQLPNKRLPAFKPLDVPRQPSAEDNTPTAGSDSDDEESEGEGSRGSYSAPAQQNDAIKGNLQSLIQTWAGRDVTQRNETAVSTSKSLSKDKQKLVTSMRENGSLVPRFHSATPADGNESAATTIVQRGDYKNHLEPDQFVSSPDTEHTIEAEPGLASDSEPNPRGSPYGDLFSRRPAPLARPVQDFNALMHGRQSPIDTDDRRALATASEAGETGSSEVRAGVSGETESTCEVRGTETEQAESDIAAIAPSSQKSIPGPVQNAFDRMRPKRTPLQTAEITIGDQTTTTVIGSELPYKRRKIHRPDDSQAITNLEGNPLVAPGLRNFAAPGSQMQLSSSQALAVTRQSSSMDADEQKGSSALEPASGVPTVCQATSWTLNGRVDCPPDSDASTSDALDRLVPASADEDDYDADYVDEKEKKTREEEKVARLIQEAELAAAQPTEENLRRASQVLKNGGKRREATLQLACYVETSASEIAAQAKRAFSTALIEKHGIADSNAIVRDKIDDAGAESRLSLTVSKTDFERMTIVGQFNLGFVLAVRPASDAQSEDELFIIDQHAADEKYNYERLQRTVTLQNQRLVRPKALDLTAIEEEIILNHADALKANGFEIDLTSSEGDDGSTTRHCRLLTLPMTGEKTFDMSDLEELLHLLSEASAGSSEIPRPKKVQKVLAMRACRGSVMVGKTLTLKQMQNVVRHMGEMEKPWNCPHGRPTMRHLAGLNAWSGWQEGDVIDDGEDGALAAVGGGRTDWKGWLAGR